MHKISQKLLLLMIVFLLIFTSINIFAYDNNDVYLRSFTINRGSSLYLEVGDTKTLEVIVTPDNATYSDIVFESSDEKIVTVSKAGVVKAIKTGKATITARIGIRTASINVTVYSNSYIQAKFTEAETVKEKIKTITIEASSKDTDVTNFYIYLPSGYMVEGTTASYPADVNGIYPFTVYDNSGTKKTFYYEVTGLRLDSQPKDVTQDNNIDKYDIELYRNDIELKYDYEKKQCLINLPLDKVRTVTLPNNQILDTNEINYYISIPKNGVLNTYTLKVDDESFKFKLIRQGEYYLLILWEESQFDHRNILVSYKAYNFTIDEPLMVEPDTDFITDNGIYQILTYTASKQKEIFSIYIDDIDYMRPELKVSLTYEDKFELVAKDNLALDYIITYDGKYVAAPKNYVKNAEFKYKHDVVYVNNGTYMFTAVDTAGNRTIEKAIITTGKRTLYTKQFGPEVHNSKENKFIFTNSGYDYSYEKAVNKNFQNIFPSYMKGYTQNEFSPNSTVTRAQMTTILCRINDVPYDINLMAKNKLTDISDHWAKNYICMGNTKKYIKGYKDKTFKPDEKLTRADFCKLVCNISTLKSKISTIPAVNNYSFEDINGNTSKAEILKLVNRDLILTQGNKFYPDKPITRAEVIYTINKLYGLTYSDDEFNYIEKLYNTYYNYKDIKNSPYYKDIVIAIIGFYREQKK